MNRTAHTEDVERELDFRANDGVQVALLWRKGDERLIVEVVDTKAADAFRFEVDASEARDAFQHPYAYAAFRDIEYIEPWQPRAQPALA